MDMKWNPIIDGDLSGIPREKGVIFTVFDEATKGTYTAAGVFNDYMMGYEYLCIGEMDIPVEVANIKAWMELPEPYQPGRCDICKHWRMWTDNFGDRRSECQLGDTVFSKGGCPLEN